MDWSQARDILCVRLDAIGDVLMTGPAMRALREAADGRRITLLTSPSGAAIAGLMPDVDEVIEHQAPWMKATPAGRGPEPDLALIEELRARRFDAAAIFTVLSQTSMPAALLCHLAGIPLRLAHTRDKAYGLLTHAVLETEPEQGIRHEVRRQLDLVATVGARTADERLRLDVPAHARAHVEALLADAGIERERPWLVLHPGSTAPSRRYPAELWAEACAALVGGHGVQVVISGDASEVELAEEVRARAGVPLTSLAGRLDLSVLAALLEAAPLLLAGNTGPVHVAAAVGTPVVDVYALTNPQHTPWEVPQRVLSHDVPCRWCESSVCLTGHHLCVRGVTPAQVTAAALELLGDRP